MDIALDIPVILSKIFSFLSLKEVLQMRLVCKDWYAFVNHFEQKQQLCVYEHFVPHKLKWTGDGAYVRETVKVKINELDFKDPLLRNIKKLFIFKIKRSGLLNSLNSLTALEELHFWAETRGPPVKLCLPNLKTLFFDLIDIETVLETPQLETLIVDLYPEKLDVLYPNSIRTLVCEYISVDKFQFPNLRRLVIIRFANNLQFDLKDFPQLKIVELYTNSDECSNRLMLEFARRLKKQRLMRSDLQILVNGFNEDVEIVFKMVGYNMGTAWIDFQTVWNNFDKMIGDFETRASFRFEDYQLLQQCCPNIEERKQFMSKFKRITTIEADQVEPAEFLDFLNEYGDCVQVLKMKTFAPIFNNRQLIPFQWIRELHVCEFQMKPNYEILLELKNLDVFVVSTFPHYLSKEILYLAAELFKRHPYFKLFQLLSMKIARNLFDPGLNYNGTPFNGRSFEKIYEIFLERLPLEVDYSRWCELFGDDYLVKYKLLPS